MKFISIWSIYLICFFHTLFLSAQEGQFITEIYASGFEQAIGLEFDASGRMYVWEKAGKIWFVENGQKSNSPLLDISDEVGGWRDFGLLSVTLDPNFLQNGYIYLFYVVDRYHLFYSNSPDYNPETDDYYSATIGRVVRYQAEANSNFTTVNLNTRKILIGESIDTGIPSLHESHIGGSLVFGTDGSLLLSTGDAASYLSNDEGSAPETYYAQALVDNILEPQENIGSYRCQSLNSLNGKILRIDPETGDGIPSNPYYDPLAPRADRSRIWARGLRNPYRMSIRPGTGSHEVVDANPGSFYIGDVGAGNREELNISNEAGQNFGWPAYEGMTYQPGFFQPQYAPETHELPKIDWRQGEARVSIDDQIMAIGSAAFPGPYFQGNCAIGGTWYQGDDFPDKYKHTFFFADYGGQWIRNAHFDENDNPLVVEDFMTNVGRLTALVTSPTNGGLYFVTNGATVQRVTYSKLNGLPPKAVISADTTFGGNQLTVEFSAENSFDPEYFPLSYSWDFGDGSPVNTEGVATHTFTTNTNEPQSFTVSLTVKDREGNSDQTTQTISLNNSPPMINRTSVDQVDFYSLTQSTSLVLEADVEDAEHPLERLDFQWQILLYHNDHNHPEPVIHEAITTTVISPVGCEDGASYWYQVRLTVSDPDGLQSTYSKNIYPNCGGNEQSIDFPAISDQLTTALPFKLQATTDANLPVSFFIVEGPARIVGDSLWLTGQIGEVVVRATQPGNETYRPAIAVEQRFQVKPGIAQIAFTRPSNLDSLYGTSIQLLFDIEGDMEASQVSHARIKVNDGPPQDIYQLFRPYTLTDLAPGIYDISIELINESNVPLANPESRDFLKISLFPGGNGQGLTATYFNGMNFDEMVLERVDEMVNFTWEGNAPSQVLPNDQFSVRWEGEVEGMVDGIHTFWINTDDGVRLWVDGELIIDQWIDQGPTTYEADVILNRGERVPIQMEYYENAGGATAILGWSNAQQSPTPIPSRYLYPKDFKYSQSIVFPPIADLPASLGSLALNAYATSGLRLEVEIISGPVIFNNGILAFTGGTGEVMMMIRQSGNDDYHPAVPIQRSFQILESVPPTEIVILSPQNGDTLLGNGIILQYELRGNWSLDSVNHILIAIDEGLPFTDYELNGEFSLPFLEPGAHQISVTAVSTSLGILTQTRKDIHIIIVEQGGSCPIPAPWTLSDIGRINLASSACISGNSLTLRAGGIDIWDVEDEFGFVQQQMDGNFEFIARVTDLEAPDPWTKAGIMIRESLNASSRHMMLVATGGNGLALQWRAETGGVSEHLPIGGPNDSWLRMVRLGQQILIWVSQDGNDWDLVQTIDFPFPNEVYAGLVLTSHQAPIYAQATFEDILLEKSNPNLRPQAPSALQANFDFPHQVSVGWQNNDVGILGYELERSIGNLQNFEFLSILEANENSALDLPASFPDGSYFYRIRSYNEFGFSAYSSSAEAVPPVDSCDTQENLASNRLVSASTVELDELNPQFAIDGNMETRWSSEFADPQWLEIDLGTVREICKIAIYWEVAFARDYEIQTSDDRINWKTIKDVSNNQNTYNLWLDLNATGRFIRIYGKTRATPYGYSIWELEIYGRDLTFNNSSLISFFPNPSVNDLNIIFESSVNQPVQFELLDVLGRSVLEWNVSASIGLNKRIISIQSIPTGTYFLKMRFLQEELVKKVLIQH